MDTGAEFDGDSSATRPLELLLLGLGGCTGMDLVPLFKKMRQEVTGLEIDVKAERAEEHPRVYSKIDLEYVVTGRGLDPDKVERAVELSQQKYCSVSAMLRQSCAIAYTVRIVDA
jgi:putative redox protein